MDASSTIVDHIASRIPFGVVAISLTLAVGTLAGLGLPQASESVRPAPAAVPDPARFILSALLVPALEVDALPLRWVDPRPAAGCADDTAVLVDGRPLQAGALVPDTPFELTWHARQCHPFGAIGPRFDGTVTLQIYREDWGFSAYARPEGLVATHRGARIPIEPGPASMPQFPDIDDDLDRAIGD